MATVEEKRMRLLSLLAGIAVLGGCATLGLVDAGETAPDPGRAVVALSVDMQETAGVVAGDLRLKAGVLAPKQ